MADLWTAPGHQPRRPVAGPRASRQITPQQRADLAALRLDPNQLPRSVDSLSAAISAAWPAGDHNLPRGWGWEQTQAFQRLRNALPH